MISLTSCLCALLFARLAVAAPASSSAVASSAAPVSSSTVISSVAPPSSTSDSIGPLPTGPYITLDPNYPLWNNTSPPPYVPIRGSTGASVLGPSNPQMDAQNADLVAPPSTDHGSVDNAKWPFALSHNRLQPGGWARNQNINDMPIATSMAGVNMRLKPGAVRELHWHTQAEWAYMLKGSTQITSVNTDGQNYIATVYPGDLWYFPAGIPHSIQATNDDPEGAEFVLVFDSGDFSEDSTFLLTDWLNHVPPEVLAKNFQTNLTAFSHIPAQELYIFPAALPDSDSVAAVVSPQGVVPDPFSFALSKVQPIQLSGGTVKVVDSTTFKASKTIAAAEVTVNPGAIRELHWHPTQDEWTFFLEGEARVTIFASLSNARTFNYQAGDIGYVPATMGHYVENTGNTTLRFLEVWKTDKFQDVSLAQWLALTPPKLVQAHLGLPADVIARLSKVKQTVIG